MRPFLVAHQNPIVYFPGLVFFVTRIRTFPLPCRVTGLSMRMVGEFVL